MEKRLGFSGSVGVGFNQTLQIVEGEVFGDIEGDEVGGELNVG
jgi:hypothetical protein